MVGDKEVDGRNVLVKKVNYYIQVTSFNHKYKKHIFSPLPPRNTFLKKLEKKSLYEALRSIEYN